MTILHRTRPSDSYRAYYRLVPRGTWSVGYTVRLNNAGTFELPATRTKVMYAPRFLAKRRIRLGW